MIQALQYECMHVKEHGSTKSSKHMAQVKSVSREAIGESMIKLNDLVSRIAKKIRITFAFTLKI